MQICTIIDRHFVTKIDVVTMYQLDPDQSSERPDNSFQ